MKSFSVFLFFLSVSANVPFFTNDASLKSTNYVPFFDCSEQILYLESALAMDNLVFVPWSDLDIDSYSKQCPNNPVYYNTPQGTGPFLLLNSSMSDFEGKLIVALVNQKVLTLQKRQAEPVIRKKSLFQTYVFFNTATFLALLTVGILLIILFFGIKILAGIQSPTKFEIKKN
jgi:hypothetical protein